MQKGLGGALWGSAQLRVPLPMCQQEWPSDGMGEAMEPTPLLCPRRAVWAGWHMGLGQLARAQLMGRWLRAGAVSLQRPIH